MLLECQKVGVELARAFPELTLRSIDVTQMTNKALETKVARNGDLGTAEVGSV